MTLALRIDDHKLRPSHPCHGIHVITRHVESTATFRTIDSERRQNQRSVRSKDIAYLLKISLLFRSIVQEMEDSPVMAEVVSPGFEFCLEKIGYQPMNSFPTFAHPFLRQIERLLRNIEHT